MQRFIRTIAASAFVIATGLGSHSDAAGMNLCRLTSKVGFESCKLGARGDTELVLGRCDNLPDAGARKACQQQASVDAKDALKTCKEQNGLRAVVCARLGPGPYAPAIDLANFNNQLFPLTPGTTFVYEGETADGFEHVEFAVTDVTKVILNVPCVEVHDTRQVNGVVVEDTRDWFAQDDEGNVWYFGENTTLVSDGLPVDLSGTWTGGVDGAQPGIIMKANPAIGDFYRQEFSLGSAEDLAEVKVFPPPSPSTTSLPDRSRTAWKPRRAHPWRRATSSTSST